MVFRGKPSKACARCRKRKLRCDLQMPSCGSCIRASHPCSGYRDTENLRINDETQYVLARATGRVTDAVLNRQKYAVKPVNPPLDLLVQARAMFFGYYITDFCRAWEFLCPYYHASTGPDHLTLSIDAVSLAFLSHNVTSASAQHLGRRKYVSALRKINVALQCPRTAYEPSTLQASLLLDLFERITNPGSKSEDSKRVHIDGALALVKLKGLNHFTDNAGMAVLTLLMTASVGYFSCGAPVPTELREVREHMTKFTDPSDPKWKLNGLALEITDVLSDLNMGATTQEERTRTVFELDKKLEQVSHDAPPVWYYERKHVPEGESHGKVLDGFYDIYCDRITTQRWNALRIVRIFLCEEMATSLDDPRFRLESQHACIAAALTIQEICASVPQMIDCQGAAQHKLPDGSIALVSLHHNHTLSHLIDAYIIIYPLYTAFWSHWCPPTTRKWIIKQLECIAEHFGIKEAKRVVEILRGSNGKPTVGPWEVYRYLGSYAFAA